MMTDLEVASRDSKATAARALTDRIRTGLEVMWQLVAEAYETRAWADLGYPSWDDYCTREFGTSRLRLPREERQEVVSSLREQGLSLRAIAAATNEPLMTVQNELARVRTRTPEPDQGVYEVEPVAPEPARVVGIDGKSYPAAAVERPSRPEPDDDTETANERTARLNYELDLAFIEIQKQTIRLGRLTYRLDVNVDRTSRYAQEQLTRLAAEPRRRRHLVDPLQELVAEFRAAHPDRCEPGW